MIRRLAESERFQNLNMLTIGIDGNEANVKERVGVSVYTLNLLRYFNKSANKDIQFNIYLKNRPSSDLPRENSFYRYREIKGGFLWSQIFLPFALAKNKINNVFFSPAHYIPRYSPVPTVVTIHDLAYLYYPNDFKKKDYIQLKYWSKFAIEKSLKIIAVSNTTKKDIVKNYGVSKAKISVVYNGYEKTIKYDISNFKYESKEHPFILYVGTLQPRKNLEVLLEAFSKFKQLYPEYELILAGKKGWLYESIFDKVTDLNLEGEVFFTDFITDKQLMFLYENAFCFVLPSLYEGFGIPLLEAMSFDCPVISSYASSLPEIGGSACLYFDPKNSYDLVDKLKRLKDDPDLRVDLIRKGKKRIKEFSWNKCAQQTLEVIKGSVLNRDRT